MTPAHAAIRPAPLLGALLPVLLASNGCTSGWGYDPIRLGMSADACARALPTGAFRRTTLGWARFERAANAAQRATVILLAPDGRVAAKFTARAKPAANAYVLDGQFSPPDLALGEARVPDALHALLAELLDYEDAEWTRRAHHLVAAGLVRMLERLPGAHATAWELSAVADSLPAVPRAGECTLVVHPAAIVQLRYSAPE